MTVYTKQITVVADEPTRVASIDPMPWRALEFDFGVGEVVWCVSHEASIPFLPAGASVLDARMLTPADYTRGCGYLSGTSTYTSPSYEVQDKDHSFSEFIAEKVLNRKSSLDTIVREYEWDSNTLIPLYSVDNAHRILSKGTWLFKNHESVGYGTKVKINCSDIYRTMDKTAFTQLQWTVAQSFSATDTQAITTIDVDDFAADPSAYWRPFEHGPHYHHQPSQTGTFARLESTGSDTTRKEIIWITAMYESGGNIVIDFERAQFLTTAQAVTVESDAEAENGPRINEWIYFDETVTTLFEFLIDGNANGRVFPTHWTAGAAGFANQYSTGFYSSEFRLQFSNPKAQEIKKFLEGEVLVPAIAVAPVNGRGQLAFNPIVLPTDADAGEIVFDESNCNVNRSMSLRHVKDDIFTEIEIKYDYDANDENSDDQFQSVARFNSVDSELFHGFSKTKSIELKGLHSGLHTNEQVKKLAGAIGDKFYFERLEISIESSINDIPLGDLVSVQFKTDIVVDDSSGVKGPLNRTMTVIEARENRTNRTTTYQLVGTLQLAQDFYAGQKTYNIEPEVYMQDAIDLAPMIASGNVVLEMGRKYGYYDGTNTGVAVGAGVNVTVVGNGPPPQIWCFGFLDWTPDIDLTGRSLNVGGIGETSANEATQGQYGFFGGQSSSSGYRATKVYRSISNGTTSFGNEDITIVDADKFNLTRSTAIAQRQGHTVFPTVVLDSNNGQLGGIPADLSGSGGAGSPLVNLLDPNSSTTTTPTSATMDGTAGGVGGGGIIFVCHGMIMRGRVTTNGGDAAVPNTQGFSGQSFSGSRGGGGAAGGMLVIVDGAHSQPLFDGDNFHAFAGANQSGDRSPFGVFSIDAADVVGPANQAVPTNLWASRLRILYTPEAANVQALSLGILGDFFSTQPDGAVKLFVQDDDPSNANAGDARITQAELDTNNADPAFRVFDPSHENAETNGWRDFDRDNDDWLYVYDALISGKRKYDANEIISSSSRPVGEADGTIWFNPTNANQWILYEDSDDILIASNQVPQGEDMIQDISFARTYAGESLWRFTLNDSLSPVLTNNPAAPLSIDNQSNVAWARFTETGGESGSAGYQIDASGLSQYNRMIFRDLIPNSGSPSMRVKLRLTSSLAANNPEFEGVAVRFRGFKLTGSAPAQSFTQVWDSDPSSKGERAWYSLNSGTFTDAVFIEPVPTDLGIDYFTFELVVRAGSGQITLSNIECRNHYAVTYDLDVMGFQGWTSGINPETVVVGISGDDVKRYLRYILTESVSISTGQLVQLIVKGAIKGRAFESQSGSNAQRLASNVGIMVKLRRRLTPSVYDYYTVSSDPVSVDNKTVYANSSEQFRARYDYDQAELLPFVEPTTLTSGYDTIGVDVLSINDIELDMIVADYVSASQGIE